MSWYYKLDNGSTIRISDHSTGTQRAKNEIHFNVYKNNKLDLEGVEKLLNIYFK
jgi:hypothetical protein